jgi:hypothetical protein
VPKIGWLSNAKVSWFSWEIGLQYSVSSPEILCVAWTIVDSNHHYLIQLLTTPGLHTTPCLLGAAFPQTLLCVLALPSPFQEAQNGPQPASSTLSSSTPFAHSPPYSPPAATIPFSHRATDFYLSLLSPAPGNRHELVTCLKNCTRQSRQSHARCDSDILLMYARIQHLVLQSLLFPSPPVRYCDYLLNASTPN